MRVLTRFSGFGLNKRFSTVLLFFGAFVSLKSILAAQDVPVTTGGIISIASGIPPVYNGQYVIQTTDFGFLWLDTVALRSGLVQAEAKCGVGQPPSATNLYVIGDCNGTGDAVSSGNYVLVHQYNSQCGTVTKGCGGTAIKGPFRLTFELGTWTYLGDKGEIANSTLAADPQGRTWKVEPTDSSGRNFNWHATGGQTTPPTAAGTATNKSAAGRADKTNYYGDQWELKDSSSTSSPITNVDWDFNTNGTTFVKDEGGAPPGESTITGFFPCDPQGPVAGDIRTGLNCAQSLGFSSPIPTGANYSFAMQSSNANGTSANVFVSAPIAVVCPEANIIGYTGFTGTCAKTGGTLTVLTGGVADASGSEGSPVSYDWTFPGTSTPSASGPAPGVPVGATTFTLTITYAGGYVATAQGNVLQQLPQAGFYTLNPCRLADTRDPDGASGGPALAANTVRTFPVANICSVPASAKAVAVNLTVVSPTGDGHLRAFAAGAALPGTSAINYRSGEVRANNAIVSVSSGGLSIQCDMVEGSTHFVIDVFGYFQ
jgi:hypothetical protein